MDLASHLTQKQLQDILLMTYMKGETAQDIQMVDAVKEIKEHVLEAMTVRENREKQLIR